MDELIDGYDQRINSSSATSMNKSTDQQTSSYTYTYPQQPLAAKNPEETTWIIRKRPMVESKPGVCSELTEHYRFKISASYDLEGSEERWQYLITASQPTCVGGKNAVYA